MKSNTFLPRKLISASLASLALALLPLTPLGAEATGTSGQDIALTSPELQRPAMFSEGQRIACIGDSITRDGEYITYLYDYYATRLPDQPIRLFNFGIGGDNLKDVLNRYHYDIRAIPTDTAMILMGMNDALRGGYTPEAETNPSMLTRREATIATFDNRLAELLSLLKADHISPILCTPTCYDETTVSKYSLTPNANKSLVALADVIKKQAVAGNLPVVELNAPLLAANAAYQANDREISLISGDRVHPLSGGKAVMAWAILRQQKAPAEVATIEISASDKRVIKAGNCEVKDLVVKPGEVSFSYKPAALPLPRNEAWETAASCTPLTRDLNQELLTVKGLADGNWSLQIGDMQPGSFSSKELSNGINLATLPKSPQLAASQKIHELNLKRNEIEQSIRGIYYLEKVMRVPPGSPESVWREQLASYRNSPEFQKLSPNAYMRKEADQYESKKPREKELYAELETATQAMYAAFPRTAWTVKLTRQK